MKRQYEVRREATAAGYRWAVYVNHRRMLTGFRSSSEAREASRRLRDAHLDEARRREGDWS
jgi:hypothetical protein